MAASWNTALWQQFGATIDMLENALVACPASLWTERLWRVPPSSEFPPQFAEFWYVTYHSLVWLDLYLSGVPEEEFAPPAPFAQGELDSVESLPERPYTKEELQTYLASLRQQCHTTLIELTGEQAQRPIEYPWSEGQTVGFMELQMYNMRHVQEHAAQLSLFLGQHGIPDEALDWVPQAKDNPPQLLRPLSSLEVGLPSGLPVPPKHHRNGDAPQMSDTNITLAIMTEGWHNYQNALSKALAPLSNEQLALRAAPNLRSIDELARHLIAVRAGWFHYQLGEGDEAFAAIAAWAEPENPTRSASELVNGLALTWQVMQEALARYTPTDLLEIVYDEDEEGNKIPLTRGWVVWHVIEHDLHHGGEIGYSLGMHGLQAPDI